MLFHLIGFFALGMFVAPWPWGIAAAIIIALTALIFAEIPRQRANIERHGLGRAIGILSGSTALAIGIDVCLLYAGQFARSLL